MFDIKKCKWGVFKALMCLGFVITIIGCSNDDDSPPVPTGQNKLYTIYQTDNSDLNGNINFIENTDASTTITITLTNATENYNVRLRRSTANIGGGVAANLNSVGATDGISSTNITALANGESISFDELIDFNGYLAIEGTGMNEAVLYAYADLGPNELTGEEISYNLFSPNGDINGSVELRERVKGSTSLTVNVFNMEGADELATNLILTQQDTDEEYTHQLSPITSQLNGFSFNELIELNGADVTYEEVLELSAYIEVGGTETSAYLAKGSIGKLAN